MRNWGNHWYTVFFLRPGDFKKQARATLALAVRGMRVVVTVYPYTIPMYGFQVGRDFKLYIAKSWVSNISSLLFFFM